MAAAFALKLAYRPLWPIKALRVLVTVGLHAFLVPLVANLASPFKCAAGSNWGSTAFFCFGSGHFGA